VSRRLLLSYLALTLVLLAALEVPLAINNNDRLRNELTTNLVRDGYTMAGYAEETVEGKGSVDLDQLATSYAERTGGRVVIVDKSGRVLADSQVDATSETMATRPEIIESLAGRVATGTRRSDTLDTDLLYAAVPIAAAQGVEGAVRITYSTAQIDDRRRDYLMTLVGVAAISLGVATVLGLVLARWVTRPVRRLERTAAQLGEGDLTARAVESTGPPEIRELAHTFNQMAHRLHELVRSQSAFVADASHQLRTPLAALQLRLENLQSDLPPTTGEGTDSALALDDIDAALAETARLARIVDGLLVLARADSAAGTNATEVVELAGVLRSRLATWEPIAAEHGVHIDAEPVDLRVRAAPDALAQVLDNLIANAIDASPPGGRVRIIAGIADHTPDESRDRVEVHVVDEGPGLSDEQRDRAFDRFWRAHPAPSALGGTGLGLAIARQLARSGGGDVELRAAPGTGLDAVVQLPRV
jgi:signal transduction histidine kinase